ncbi:unnamed protein product [Phytophthora fragariaefolia]|uniref:Unnamed protein product n=1 Tax=Phytophthora fragariaefolia TaxID=1490495 RepID=A0A9W6XL43_9STRA|nr:unnamed protein product [Phytophthora fragariaefolia]
MKYEHGAEDVPMDSDISTGRPNATSTHTAREDCPHLADPEWKALQRLATVIREAAVETMLCTLSPTEHHGVALGFIMKEQREVTARATVSTPSTPRVESLKFHVNSYVGRESEPLLRWLVEVFKEELRQALEPPQNEFRSIAKFPDLQQGKHDVHAYAQRARYLVSNIVTNPIDEVTKAVKAPPSPAGDAVECVGIGHSVSKTAAISENHSDCKKQDDKPNHAILKVNSKRGRSLRALVDCGASNNFVRLQSLVRLDFEEVELPRSLLEMRLATGVVVRAERRVVRARFSYEEKKFVDELIVLDLDYKFDMVLGMPWLARHDPVIDWAKRTIVRFRTEAARGAAASDPPARTLTTERAVREKCEPPKKTQIRSDLRGSRSVKNDAVVSTVVDTQDKQDEPVTEGSEPGASVPGPDAIDPNVNGLPAVRRRGDRGTSAPGADAASSSDGCNRPAPEMLACSRAAGLHDEAVHNQVRLGCVFPRVDPAGDQKAGLSTAGPGQNKTRRTGFHTRSERRKRAKLRKSRSGTKTDTTSSVCRADTAIGDGRRDPEYLEAYEIWSPVSEDGAESPLTLASELTSLPASYELRPFVVYTDHASLRMAIKPPHISQRMARWLSFFAEYDFQVEYKPGRLNVVADALSCGPDYAVHKADANAIGVVRTSTPSSSLLDDAKSAYTNGADAKQLLDYIAAPSDKTRQKLPKHLRTRVHCYRVHNGLLLYSDRVVVPNDHELKLRITNEYHDAPTSEHPGREKTYLRLTRAFYWSHQYKWVGKYVRACEVCQRVKPAPSSQAPLQSLPTSSDCWQSIPMDFVFSLPPDKKRRTGIVVFVDRFSKMVHLAAVPAEGTAKQTAGLFVDMVFRHHGVPFDISTVSTPGVDTLNTNEQHIQVRPVVIKDVELNTEFSSKAMDFVKRRQAVIRFVQDVIAASVDRQKLDADNNDR